METGDCDQTEIDNLYKTLNHFCIQVMLARNKTSNKLYAIKFLKKKDVLRRNQVSASAQHLYFQRVPIKQYIVYGLTRTKLGK